MCGEASGRASTTLPCLVIIKCSNDVEGIQTSIGCISDIDDLTMQIMCKLRVLILRVKYEDLGILGGQIQKQRFRGIGFTGTGLTHDNHIRIDTFRITTEEIDKYRDSIRRSQLDTALVGNMSEDPGIHSSNGIGRNAPGLLRHGIIG